ncbi:LamG domain-containing protein [Patescibacteria group bacterium]|nr:LamG domain-containing protein [Patescibacteria group bacterium]
MAATELYSTPLFDDADLVAYWRLENNAEDSKNSYDGTASNITYAAGKFGTAAVGNGSNGYITMGVQSALNITTGNATWSFWMRFTSFANQPMCFSNGLYNTYGYFFRVPSAGLAYFRSNQSGAHQDIPIEHALSVDTTYFITITKSGTTINIYVNGSLDGTGSITNPTSSTEPFYLLNYTPTGLTLSPSGWIDDFAVFSSVLTTTEISNLYNGWPSGYLPRMSLLGTG